METRILVDFQICISVPLNLEVKKTQIYLIKISFGSSARDQSTMLDSKLFKGIC